MRKPCLTALVDLQIKAPIRSEVNAMKSTLKSRLIQFLQEELAIPADSIAIALRYEEEAPSLLPMVLWQYGLVTLDQLNKIFDWLETAS
jgi:hypothetical protein